MVLLYSTDVGLASFVVICEAFSCLAPVLELYAVFYTRFGGNSAATLGNLPKSVTFGGEK